MGRTWTGSAAGVVAALGAAMAATPALAQDTGSPYADAVIADAPRYYWRLGEADVARDWMRGYATDATYGEQVLTGEPGAIVGDPDESVELLGGVPDQVWGSHVIADPRGVYRNTIAPGRTHLGLEAWVKPRTLDGRSRRIVSRELPAGGYLLAARDDELVFSRYAGGRSDTVSAPPLQVGSWSHVVANYDDDHVMRLYVDGELVAQRPSDLELPDVTPLPGDEVQGSFVLGASGRLWHPFDPDARLWLEWDGWLDEVAVYGGKRGETLAAEQVRRHWLVGSGQEG